MSVREFKRNQVRFEFIYIIRALRLYFVRLMMIINNSNSVAVLAQPSTADIRGTKQPRKAHHEDTSRSGRNDLGQTVLSLLARRMHGGETH